MLCQVYKSPRREEMYLYVDMQEDLDRLDQTVGQVLAAARAEDALTAYPEVQHLFTTIGAGSKKRVTKAAPAPTRIRIGPTMMMTSNPRISRTVLNVDRGRRTGTAGSRPTGRRPCRAEDRASGRGARRSPRRAPHTAPHLKKMAGESNPKCLALALAAILAVAAEYGVPVFEDDCYADLVFSGDRPPAGGSYASVLMPSTDFTVNAKTRSLPARGWFRSIVTFSSSAKVTLAGIWWPSAVTIPIRWPTAISMSMAACAGAPLQAFWATARREFFAVAWKRSFCR